MSDSGPAPKKVLPLSSTDWVTPDIDFDHWKDAFKKPFTREVRRAITRCVEKKAFSVRYISEREFKRRMKQLAKDGDASDDEDMKWHVRYHSDRTGNWQQDVRKAINTTDLVPIVRATQAAELYAREAYEILKDAGFNVTLSDRWDVNKVLEDEKPEPVEQFLIELFFPTWGSDPSGCKKLYRALKKQ